MKCIKCRTGIPFASLDKENYVCVSCGTAQRLPIQTLMFVTFGLGWLPWIACEFLFMHFEHVVVSLAVFLISHLVLLGTSLLVLNPTAGLEVPGSN